MAETGKAKIAVSKMINPFSETKTKKVPDWFSARPDILRQIAPLTFSRTMELDPRKWKKKVIEDGIYAVARYELQLFATRLGQMEKEILKARPKDRQKAKFVKGDKNETPEEKKALDKAQGEVTKLYKKIAKTIQDKVSLALDEVESDKGDNKKALAAGKEILKKMDNLDLDDLFADPTDMICGTLLDLAAELDDDNPDAFKMAKEEVAGCEKEFDAKGRAAKKVVDYLLYKGAKIAKDKDADPALQEVGKLMTGSKGTFKSSMTKLSGTIDAFDKQIDQVFKVVKGGKVSSAQARSLAKKFESENGNKDKAVAMAVKDFKVLAQKFKAAQKQVKK